MAKYINLDGLSAFATKLAESLKTKFASKQDTLVSGTNIKTVNGETVLGSGDITIESGTVTVDGGLDSLSENPVTNAAITNAINLKLDTETIHFFAGGTSNSYDSEAALISALGVNPSLIDMATHQYLIVATENLSTVNLQLIGIQKYVTTDESVKQYILFFAYGTYMQVYTVTITDSQWVIESSVYSALTSENIASSIDSSTRLVPSCAAVKSALPQYTNVTLTDEDYTIPANDTTNEMVYIFTTTEDSTGSIFAANGVKWMNSELPTYTAGNTVVVSIVKNLAAWSEFAEV